MMPVAEERVWHRPPTAVMANGNRRERTVRYTWAGPFNTQLYDDQLRELSNTTRDNLNRLANTLMEKNQPCGQFGIRHWHPESRPENGTPVQSARPQSQGSWSNISVMFTSADALDSLSRGPHSEVDDTSSITSTTSVAMNFCYLCSTMEEHRRNHMKKFAPRSRSLPRQRKQHIDYIAPPPRQKKKPETPLLVLDALYKVTVWTGDVPGAGTDAHVYITIVGEQDVLPKTRLWHQQGTSKFCFVCGSKKVFYLKAPKLGDLHMVTIEHDGLEKRHGWYLDQIEIQCMQTKRVWIFTCKNWLSMHHGDFCIKRDLEPKEKERVWREFEVTVETGKKRMAGTDANVYITVRGAVGSSHKFHLNAKNKGKCFQKNSVDKFHIRLHDIGEIRSLRVEHDASGLASGWFLDKITLQDIHNPACMYHFLYHGWLAKDIGDGHLWRELRAKKSLPKEVTHGQTVQYKVVVKTGNVLYAGTDANVHIVFVGSRGKTKPLKMDDARDNFERGMEETFELNGKNVGTLKSIILGHDNSGPGAGWYCEDVKVIKYLSRDEIAEQVQQQKKLWRTKKLRQRKRLADKLNHADAEGSNLASSDLDEESEEEVGKLERRSSRDDCFADMFDRDGKVVKVPVYEEYYIPCQKWFATDEGDGLIERELDVKGRTLYFQER